MSPMCEIPHLPAILVWTFLGSAIAMAFLSRGLNDHLLEIPPPPSGPFSFLFRRRYHVRPYFFLAPRKFFDEAGQQWVRRFLAVLAWTVLLLAALGYVLYECRIAPAG